MDSWEEGKTEIAKAYFPLNNTNSPLLWSSKATGKHLFHFLMLSKTSQYLIGSLLLGLSEIKGMV